MKFAELKREFNVIIDAVGDTPIVDQERFDELVAQHLYIYEHNEYFVGVKLGYQVKDRVVEPLYMVSPIVRIDGELFAVTVPSDEVTRMGDALFSRWKKGDEDFFDVFDSENIFEKVKGNG